MKIGLLLHGGIEKEFLSLLVQHGDGCADACRDIKAQVVFAVAPDNGQDAAGIAFSAKAQAHVVAIGRFLCGAPGKHALPDIAGHGRIDRLLPCGTGTKRNKKEQAEEPCKAYGQAVHIIKPPAFCGFRPGRPCPWPCRFQWLSSRPCGLPLSGPGQRQYRHGARIFRCRSWYPGGGLP